MATSEAQKRAVAKYDAENTKRFHFKVNLKTERDILEWIESRDKFQTALKAAIREQIKKEKAVE